MSTSQKKPAVEWRLKKFDPELLENLGRGRKLQQPTLKAMAQAGLTDSGMVESFLNPSLEDWTGLKAFSSLKSGAKAIVDLLEEHQPVCIHGDFDSDGLCATHILTNGLKALGVDVFGHCPRRGDGHGISVASLEGVVEKGAKLVITVDCGTSAFEEAKRAKELGVPLFITDHHLPDESLPEAECIINPQLEDDGEPWQGLSGSGIAFKLILEISQHFPSSRTNTQAYQTFFRDALVMAAIATIADVMPLTGPNRPLVQSALSMIGSVENLGLKGLVDHVTKKDALRAEDLAFQLIPRLNAAQRLEQPELIQNLFSASTPEEAKKVCGELDTLNQRRRELQERFSNLALTRVQETGAGQKSVVIVMGDEWPESFNGLIASRLVGEYHRPAVVIRKKEDYYQASCRAPQPYHLKEVLDSGSQHLLGHGGHAQAAGFQINKDNWEPFEEHLLSSFSVQSENAQVFRMVLIDDLPFTSLNEGLAKEISLLEPFGQGNPKPLFACRGLLFDGSLRFMGKDGNHVGFKVFIEGQNSIDGVAFGMAESFNALDSHGKIDLAFYLGTSPYNGRLQLMVQAVRPHQTPKARVH
jgi:single-stranded-DNA-specific exonuclease